MKSAGFHEIHWISWPWNPYFFHSWDPTDINVMYKSLAWNLVDSTIECCIFHQNQYRYTWMSLLHDKYAVYISPCHEIHRISWSWNLPDSMKSTRFHTDIHYYMLNMQCISPWNPPDFMVKFGRFHEIRQIPKWAKDPWSYFFYINQISNSLVINSPRLSLWPGAILSY